VDARTIVFELTRPAGDFLHRLTLPATAPVPEEVARCFEGKPRRYGSDLVASGPYMIEGAEAVRTGSCASLRPMRGISTDRLTLVRNPRYDPRTDSPAAREANPDRFVFVAPHEGGARMSIRLAGKVLEGELDDAILYTQPKALRRYTARAAAHGRLRVSHPYWRFYIAMNLTQPPFDDVHVRRALSWVVNRAAFLDAAGGSAGGSIPQHIVPDALLGGRLKRFAPFRTPGSREGVPSVDRDLARCRPLTGARRLDCYATLDRRLSAEIVPWIPFLWHSRINILGRQVARWRFDQSTGTTSFAHVALRR